MRDKIIKIEIDVKDDGLIYFGQRLYTVEAKGSKLYEDKCPVCDGTHTVVIREREFKCPHCSGYSSRSDSTRIKIRDYQPVEYIINKMTIAGDETKSAYGGDGSVKCGYEPNVGYEGFTKRGNGYSGIKTREFRSVYLARTKDANSCNITRGFVGSCTVFSTKAEAVEFAKRLHERQAEMLEAFNKEHGTEHPYPFEI